MPNFAQTSNPTPYGVFDADLAFQAEADNTVTFVKRFLGDDVLGVELTKKDIWLCLEQSTLAFGSLVNQYQTVSQITSFLGLSTGSLTGSEQKYPQSTLEFLTRQAAPYSAYAGMGGAYNSVSGSIALEAGRQDYDLYRELVDDTSKVPLAGTFLSGSKMRIGEIFHFSTSAAFRFFDSTSAINYLNNEFGFESFTPETIFYVLPVFEDVLRAGQMKVSQRVRRSNYSYQVVGTRLRIFPAPSSQLTSGATMKLWIRVFATPDPLHPDIPDTSITGVSNISNIPFGNLVYANLNSISRQWIRQHTLALCKEVLGRHRSKISRIPIPSGEIELDGQILLTEGREEKEKLQSTFKEMLESLTYDKIIAREADKAEAMLRQLRLIPMPNGLAITMG